METNYKTATIIDVISKLSSIGAEHPDYAQDICRAVEILTEYQRKIEAD
jgi:hypothetical protein